MIVIKRESVEEWTLPSWWTRVKIKENKKRDKYLNITRQMKKEASENECKCDAICHWCTQNDPQRLG